jgi:uncharacterized protein RhaS with RHS repeats
MTSGDLANTWLTQDPIGEEGGINLYGFVGSNPAGGIDLLGLKVIVDPNSTEAFKRKVKDCICKLLTSPNGKRLFNKGK